MVDCRLKRNRNLSVCRRENPNVKKFKCWRKAGTNRWKNNGDLVAVNKVPRSDLLPKNKRYESFVLEEKGSKVVPKSLTTFSSKEESIRKAKSYMKKYDKC